MIQGACQSAALSQGRGHGSVLPGRRTRTLKATRSVLLSSYKRPSPKRLLAAWLLTFLALSASAAHGQSSTYARVVGTVKDQTGAVLPGVRVTATARATSAQTPAVTNDRGDYVIDKLIPGGYALEAKLLGYKTQNAPVRFEVSQVARVDFTMTPGEITETVTVAGQGPIIDTDNAETGAVVEERKILDLPLQGRDLVKLSYLNTGGNLSREGEQSYQRTDWFGGGYPSFNGLYSHSNQITLDGSNNQSAYSQRPVVQATPETVQEFKIITTNYSAEYGRVGGAVISMLSKSGTNEFHGHGWHYFRDEHFDAANFFTNKLGGEKLPVDYRIFGGSLGGPVVRDKTFFHAHYERFIDNFQTPSFMTVPSTAMAQGDFSGAGPRGPIPQLYNVFDVVDGQRQPFDGNRIPQHLWNPVYRRVVELIPPPALNVDGVTARNYSYPRTRDQRINKYSIRGDHQLGGGDSLFGRFSWQNFPTRRNTNRYPYPGADLNGAREEVSDEFRGWQAAVGWVNPWGSNLVSELNISLWKSSWLFSSPVEDRDWGQELGYDDAHLNPVYFPNGTRASGGLLWIALNGYDGWRGASELPVGDIGTGLKYTVSWRRGDHYLKFGIEHNRYLDVTFTENVPYAGGFDFYDGFATGQIRRAEDGSISGATFGQPWADFLLGLPAAVGGNNLGLGTRYARYNQSHYNAFVNDDWKVGPNLTLNLGLRWEQPRPPTYEGSPDGGFENDYYLCGFDYSQARNRIDPVQMVPRDFDISEWQGPTGLAVDFQRLSGRSCYQARWRYFSPRFGLAWRLFGGNRTVLRLGGGLNYDQELGHLKARGLFPARGRYTVNEVRGTETPSLFTGQRLDLAAQDRNSYSVNYHSELEWEEGQVYSYNLSIQHEIFPATKFEIGYVGNQGRHIREISPFNVAMPEGYVAPLIDGASVALTSDRITAGPRPWIPGDTSTRAWSGLLARRPYPQVDGNVMTRPHGNTNYNSLQARLERRFQDGVALNMGYTWSKAMALNTAGQWGQFGGATEYERHNLKTPMQHDRSQTFYTSAIWELPFFRRSKGLTRTLLGGWKAATIMTLTSGAPFIIHWGQDLWNQGFRSALRMDRIGDGNLDEDERSVDRWFDTSAFVPPVYDSSLCQGADICHEAARRALGNSAFSPLRYDGSELVDISLHKQFAFGETRTLDFRVDLFNAFNHAIFYKPPERMSSTAAGRVTQAATPRQIQFGFRFSF